MTNEEALAYFINSNEQIITAAKDENMYNYETQQIEYIFMRRDFEAKEIAIKAIKQTRWIPVSERLPEDGELILFSTKTEVYEGRYFDDNTDRQWYSFRDDAFAWNNVVTAWMPLPTSYQEESEE